MQEIGHNYVFNYQSPAKEVLLIASSIAELTFSKNDRFLSRLGT
jgi:hypothetical protein